MEEWEEAELPLPNGKLPSNSTEFGAIAETMEDP